MREEEIHLLDGWLDGSIDDAELPQLQTLLRDSAEARRMLRSLCAVEAKLTECAAANVAMPDLKRASLPRIEGRVRGGLISDWFAESPPRGVAVALALALALLGLSATFEWRGEDRGARIIAEVEDVVGTLNWTGLAADSREPLERGARLQAGNLQLEGEGAIAQMRFIDGTRLTLSGGAEVMVSDEGQKQVRLKAGALRADVRPQPAGYPMQVRTPTARVEVMGTVFSMSTGADLTTLRVEKGAVLFRRLADDTEVAVPAEHDVMASLDVVQPLVAHPGRMPPKVWRADLTRQPTPGSKGNWVPGNKGETAHLEAVPLVVGRNQKGRPLVQHGIGFRDQRQPLSGAFVTVAEDSVIRLRFRTREPASLLLFCITQGPGGGFGGNFELRLPSDSGEPDAGGWRIVEAPLSHFRPLQPHRSMRPAGNAISHFSVKTLRQPAALEVAAVAIESFTP